MKTVFSPYCYFAQLFHSAKAALIAALCLFFLLVGCQSKQSHTKNEVSEKPFDNHDLAVQNAIGFNIQQSGNCHVLELYGRSNDQSDTLKYVLARDKKAIPPNLKSLQFIKTPVERIVLLHSSYLSFFKVLNEEKAIVGISEEKYIYDSAFRKSIDSGKVATVGFADHLNTESILALKPQVVVTVGFPNAPNKDFQQLETLGIPVIIFSDWQEKTLLGRAEWIKAVAVLFDQGKEAQQKFSAIDGEYSRLVELAKSSKDKPSVIFNLPFKGVWYMPGGESYMANLLKDAGATYHWEDTQNTGALNLDFEAVYPVALNADYWINPGTATTLNAITSLDERMGEFKSFKTQHVYNAYKRTRFGQANDYWESGLSNPQTILADMIHILHPALLPQHTLYYFEPLK